MLLRQLTTICKQTLRSVPARNYSGKKGENPIFRTLRILGSDITNAVEATQQNKPLTYQEQGVLPKHADVVVIGGAAVGSSVAHWLKEKTGEKGLSVVVIEKDPSYKQCSTVLSLGGLRQQFSLSENIQMSVFGAEFIRTLKECFGKEADVYFTPNGYLILASERGASQLIDNYSLQKELGAVNALLSKEQLKKRFPWLNVEDIELGCLGLEKEGWFDPWALLSILRRQAIKMGTNYVNGKVIDFVRKETGEINIMGRNEVYEGTNELVVELSNGETQSIEFSYCVIAAGGDSGEIAQLASIGKGEGLLSIPLPVEKRKRYVYCFECQGENAPSINTPLTIDNTGAYFRREGMSGIYLCGLAPEPEEEPNIDSLEVDHSYFEERVWPIIAHRVPAFNAIKVRNSWGGYYDHNYFDENGIVGVHPYYHNIVLATGFSGHGIQQAPAVGRAVAELIIDGSFQTIDLTRLGFDRLIVEKPMLETCIF